MNAFHAAFGSGRGGSDAKTITAMQQRRLNISPMTEGQNLRQKVLDLSAQAGVIVAVVPSDVRFFWDHLFD
ncbi:MAG TPA: hypothetical protein VNI35_08355 [Nitrospira sp.]|nr:hypothetical protein [Nitrospira sp.]